MYIKQRSQTISIIGVNTLFKINIPDGESIIHKGILENGNIIVMLLNISNLYYTCMYVLKS